MTRLSVAFATVAVTVGSIISVAFVGCSHSAPQPEGTASASQVQTQTETSTADQALETGKGMAALREAARSNQYLFAFFFKADDEQTLAMRKVFDKAMEKVANRAYSVAVNTTDASEKSIVAKFDLERAPMLLVLALAPNGAITGGFPTKFQEQQLLEAFASPTTEKCMKSLQDGKLVLLCVQNEKTKSNDAAMKGVNDFKADERFGHATTIITLDPMDKKEASFLADLQVPIETTEAVTEFLPLRASPLLSLRGRPAKRHWWIRLAKPTPDAVQTVAVLAVAAHRNEDQPCFPPSRNRQNSLRKKITPTNYPPCLLEKSGDLVITCICASEYLLYIRLYECDPVSHRSSRRTRNDEEESNEIDATHDPIAAGRRAGGVHCRSCGTRRCTE